MEQRKDKNMENEKQLVYVNEKGDEVLCEILFTFDSKEFGKNYVLFYPIENSEDEEIEIMAAAYASTDNGDGELIPIESDEEWALIEEVLQSFNEEDEDDEEFDEDEEDCENCEDCDCGHKHDK